MNPGEGLEECASRNPDEGNVEVLLLGSAHIAEFNDVLDSGRQAELRTLVDLLETWNPDGVAVERPRENQAHIDDLYEDYRSGDKRYKEDVDTESSHPMVEGTYTIARGEAVQIGFRLADRLDHDRVYAVDYPMYMDEYLDENISGRAYEEAHQAAVSTFGLPDREHHDQLAKQWDDASIPEFLARLNRDERLATPDDTHFGIALAGFDDHYQGARLLTGWYERNIHIMENLYWATEDGDLDRLLVVIGYSHVDVLRHLLATAPPFTPVSPRPLLTQ